MKTLDFKTATLPTGATVAYHVAGGEGPWLTLAHALLASSAQWIPQLDRLSRTHRVLVYDTRGHGGSSTPRAPYAVSDLSSDLVALLDALKIARTHLLGASMSGLVVQHFAAAHPARVDRLILANTTWKYGPETAPAWDGRIAMARKDGIPAVVEPTLARFLTDSFRATTPDRAEILRAAMKRTTVEGFTGCCQALFGTDLSAIHTKIAATTMLVAGEFDIATTPSVMAELRDRIAGSTLAVIKGAHLCNYENPDEFNASVEAFLR